jgi:hypothetical protein
VGSILRSLIKSQPPFYYCVVCSVYIGKYCENLRPAKVIIVLKAVSQSGVDLEETVTILKKTAVIFASWLLSRM